MEIIPVLLLVLLFGVIGLSITLFFVLKNLSKHGQVLDRLAVETSPLGKSIVDFSREIGEVKASTQTLGSLRFELKEKLDDQNKKIQPLSENLDHLVKYFGGVKSSAGKVGELTFELLVKDLPPGQVFKNIQFKNQNRLEFIIRIGDSLVPVDAKFTGKAKTYFKKAVKDVSSKYLGQEILNVDIFSGLLESERFLTTSFGLIFLPSDELLQEVYGSEEMRVLMLEKRVWAVSPSNFYWQLFFFNWLEEQTQKSEDVSLLIQSINLHLVKISDAIRLADTAEKQMRQGLANLEKLKSDLLSSKTNLGNHERPEVGLDH